MGNFVFIILSGRCLNGNINKLAVLQEISTRVPILRSDRMKVIRPCKAIVSKLGEAPPTKTNFPKIKTSTKLLKSQYYYMGLLSFIKTSKDFSFISQNLLLVLKSIETLI